MNERKPPAPEPFPWGAAMEFGFGTLKLSSEAFWAMTPRELAAAMRAHSGPPSAHPLKRAELDRLMRAFPDHSEV